MGWKNDSTSEIVIMHRMDITAANHPEQGVYLRRWYIFRCRFFGVMVHKIMRHDVDRDLHDHPWAFASIVLKGGYNEEVHCPVHGAPCTDVRVVTRTNVKRHGAFHRIAALHRHPTWTLVFTGPKRSSWGFMVGDEHVPWRDYVAGEAQ